MIAYFSSASNYTHRFVEKLKLPAVRIPLRPRLEPMILIDEPKVLIFPTYGAGPNNAVPKQVIKFLNIEQNRNLIKGVIAAGNTNFGEFFGLGGDIVSNKLQVPVLYRFEITGTPYDVERVREGIHKFLEEVAKASNPE